MKKVIKEKQAFIRKEVTRAEAKAFFEEKKQSYKVGRLADIPETEAISFYSNGEFIDLCAGTHLKNTGRLRRLNYFDWLGLIIVGMKRIRCCRGFTGRLLGARRSWTGA